jgi:hypothetical protein
LKKVQGIASEALTEIADIWKVDQARTIPTDNGFDWWPGDFRVSVSALPRTDGHVPETWMLSVKTDFLKDIPVRDDRFIKAAGLLSGEYSGTYAWVFQSAEVWDHYGTPGHTPQLWFANTAYLTAESAVWLPAFLAQMSILQPLTAEIADKMVGELGGGVPNTSKSRLLGRSHQQVLLHETFGLYHSHGISPNRWIDSDEFETLAGSWGAAQLGTGRADGRGFSLDIPLGDFPARIRLSVDQKDPALGNGLRCSLRMPVGGSIKSMTERCASLNLQETMWTDIPQFGCWHPFRMSNDGAVLQYSSFIPNYLYGKGIASLAVLWLYQRFRWMAYREFPT